MGAGRSCEHSDEADYFEIPKSDDSATRHHISSCSVFLCPRREDEGLAGCAGLHQQLPSQIDG